MPETFSESQLIETATRLNPDFEALPDQERQATLAQIQSTIEALEADGWQIRRGTDQLALDTGKWLMERIQKDILGFTPKAVIVLSLHVAIVSAAMLQGDRIVQLASPSLRPLVGVLMISLFLAGIAALWMAIRSITPKSAKSTKNRSLLFYGTIAKMDKSEYVERFLNGPRQDLICDLLEDIHALSELAAWKHGIFARAFQIVLIIEIPLMGIIALLVATR